MVGYLQAVFGKNNFLVKFKYLHNKHMSCVLLSYICSKEEVCSDMDEPISDLPKNDNVGC